MSHLCARKGKKARRGRTGRQPVGRGLSLRQLAGAGPGIRPRRGERLRDQVRASSHAGGRARRPGDLSQRSLVANASKTGGRGRAAD